MNRPERRPVKRERDAARARLDHELVDYLGVFNLSPDELKNKKILEIGAYDRRFAAALAINDITRDVYSLEPALGKPRNEFASQKNISYFMDRIPARLRSDIQSRSVTATAEHIPLTDKSFDLALGRSVNFESQSMLVARLRELLRISREVRLYPVVESEADVFRSALDEIRKDTPIAASFKKTVDTRVRTEKGMRRVREAVLILREAIPADAWDRIRKSVDRITDGLGKGLDAHIKETVVAFMAHKFPTNQSCEGHLDQKDGHGIPFPWVEVIAPEPVGWRKDKTKQRAWTAENTKHQERARILLEEFNATHDVDPDIRLTISPIGIFGGFRVQSAAAEAATKRPRGVQHDILDRSRKEMKQFATFLKKKYLQKAT